ncbi:MAG: hypothetical protein HYZ22_17495 [Chloroflexi bacterium]|nr:hypothetical protein [Chloroflexota bacterium]
MLVIVIGWVIFRSPTPDFAFDYLGRLAGDMNGVQVLPFELTSPLPFIEPSFMIALVLGLLLCLPWGEWLGKLFPDFYIQEQLAVRVIFDAGLLFLFFASLASAVSASFNPGIYGAF